MSASAVLSVIASQFDDVAGRSDYLSMAEGQTSRCFYGTNADRAVALRAAHMMSLDKSLLRTNGETGAISSKKEGDLAIGFVAGAGRGINDLDQTHYGKQLKGLANGSGPAIAVTGGNIGVC